MKRISLKKLLINNKELLFGLIVGLILSSTAVFAVIKYASTFVFYRNTSSHLNATTVQAAIDELYTTCTSRAYTLTADSKGGAIPTTAGWSITGSTATKPVIFNSEYGTLPLPTKAGYSFLGWFTKDSGGTEVTSSTTYRIAGDSTIHAHWSGNTYTATFYYQSNTTSGSTTISSKTAQCTVSSGSSCSVTIPTEVIESSGTYNNKYVGLSTSTGNMTVSVAGTDTTVTLTDNTSYYSLYRTRITIAYPTSESESTTKSTYQNQWFTSNTALSTTVLSTSTTGTSNNATIGTLVSDYSLVGFSTSASTNTATWTTLALLTQSDSNKATSRTVYQIEKKTANKTATFYYNNDTTCGSTTVDSVTASGTQTTFLRCTSTTAAGTSVSNGSITVPTEVTGSKGPYNATYINVASAVNSMSAATVNTGTLTYYAFYRSNVKRYYPSSTSAATSDTIYRNEVFTSTTAMKTVLATTTTGTSTNATAKLAVSGYDTLVGFNTAASTNTQNSGATIAALAKTCNTTVYEIDKKTESKTATFYYNNDTTCGSTTVDSATASGTQTTFLRCTSTTASGTSVSNGSITIPTEVTGSKGPYNATYINVASAVNSMSAATVNTGTLTYYAFYRSNVKRYYPSSTSAATSDTIYRNEVFTSTTAMKTVLATTTTGTSTNTTAKLAVSGYDTLVGFNTAASTNTQNSGATIAALAKTCNTTVYEIDKKTEAKTATFYYQSSATNGTCSVTSATASGTQTTFLRCTSTTAAGTSVSNGSITVPTVVSSSVGQYNNAYVGVASSTASMTAATVNTETLTYYAFYRTNVTNYYWNSSSYASRTLYRKMTLSSTTACGTTYLSTSSTSQANYSTATGPGSSVWQGLSTGHDTTAEYTTVAGAAASNSATLYTVYQMNVTYSKGANVSAIGATSGSCKLVSSATASATTPNSCNVTLPSITANTGATAVGWSTTNGATTGTAAGSNYSVTSNSTKLYGNAKLNTYSVTYNAGGTCTGATGLPSAQTKTYGVSLTLSSTQPTCSGKVFLGWSTTSNATSSSTWYDGGTAYTGNAALTLYAQFYDVSDLEQSYTSYVQSGDLEYDGTVYTGGSLSQGSYPSHAFTAPDKTGYTMITTSGWSMSDGLRPYRIHTSQIAYTAMIAFSSYSVTNRWLYIFNRTSSTYNSDSIDERIDRLQKLSDVALDFTSDDIKVTNNKYQNGSIASKSSTTYYTAPASNYTRVGTLGFEIDCDSGGCSRLSVTSDYTGNIRVQNNNISSSVSFDTIDARWLDIKNKEVRTTTFSPSSNKGLARYNALAALASMRSKYFPRSYLKVITVSKNGINCEAWAFVQADKYISLTDGRILGITSYSSSSAYPVIKSLMCWTTNLLNGRTGSDIYQDCAMGFRLGNTSWASSAGASHSSVNVSYTVLYISSNTASVSDT